VPRIGLLGYSHGLFAVQIGPRHDRSHRSVSRPDVVRAVRIREVSVGVDFHPDYGRLKPDGDGRRAFPIQPYTDADALLAFLPLLELGTFLDGQLSGYSRRAILLPGRLTTAGVVVALLLALVGVVALVAEGVARRTREIGVRVALGASSRQVLATVAREGILTTASGLVVGLVLVVGLHRTLSGTLFNYYVLRLGADTLQPSLLAGVSAAVMFVTVAVTFASARRALSVDPVEALRSE
jgi:ABC-type antimicrobial peptide transport system permease subunit